MSTEPQNVVTIKIGGQEPQAYMLNLSKAISEVLMMALERDDTEYREDEAFALWSLASLQIKLATWRK